MSRSIWTRCGAKSNCRPLALVAWRAVEAQHIIATRKLVDSDEEQRLLEELIDGVKPPRPAGEGFDGLHWLLYTPFRHPPLRHGSRFGRRTERGIWYGAESLATVFAEKAYYRLLFLQGTEAAITPVTAEISAFSVPIATTMGVDLGSGPFADHVEEIASRTDYTAPQQLGSEMRADGVEVFLYVSARDRQRGRNIGVFTPLAFAARRPDTPHTWYCTVTKELVEFTRRNMFERVPSLQYPREDFLVDGALPSPAV